MTSGRLAVAELYDLETNIWSTTDTMAETRYRFVALDQRTPGTMCTQGVTSMECYTATA